jgi:aminoglycoside phosphotransferase (APT) family kinase protein
MKNHRHRGRGRARDFVPEGVAVALGISPSASLSPAPQGMTSDVVFVDDGGRLSVLKRCRDPRYLPWVRREHEALVALSKSSLPIPRLLGYHEGREDDQVAEAWLLMTRLPGEPLWDVMRRATVAQREAHLRQLGTLLREVHSTPAPAAFRQQPSWMDRTFEQARKNLAWCDGSAELLAQLDATRPPIRPDVVIHGDLALDNVLVEEGGRMSLIDWSGGDLGDARYDISLALATTPEIHLREADIAAFFDSYGSPALDAATRRWFGALYEFF